METAHAETIRLQHIKDAAQQAATARAARLAADRDRLRLAADGLRGDLATAEHRLSTATDAARAEYAATVRAVLGELADTAVKLAGKADGHASDIRLMREASGQKISDERYLFTSKRCIISHMDRQTGKSTAPAAPGILIGANIMQVRSTAKFFAFTGKFQTPEGGFGQATAYVKKETWAKTAQHYGWGANALPTDKIADGGTLSEVLFDRCMIARLVWG